MYKSTGGSDAGKDNLAGKQIMQSAPPKYQSRTGGGSGTKFMEDAQSIYNKEEADERDKVYIPERFDELDSDSESDDETIKWSSEVGQSSKNGD